MTTYTLTPPSVAEGIRDVSDPLWRWMRTDVAKSLVKIDGTWRLVRLGSYPGEAGLEAVYQGGRSYEIDQATYEELVADGLGGYVEVSGVSYDDLILADSPLIYLKLDEAEGDLPQDSSGNGFHAADAEGTPVAGLHTGSSAARSVPDDYAFDVFGHGAFGTTSGFTWELWVDCAEGDGPDVYIYNTSEDGGFGMDVDFTSGSSDGYVLRSGGIAEIDFDPLSAGVHYLAASWDNSTFRVYVDGVEVGSSSDTSGALDADEVYCLMNGTVDSFALYGEALTLEQIQAHYNAGVA